MTYSITPEAERVLRNILGDPLGPGTPQMGLQDGRWVLYVRDPVGELELLVLHEDFGEFVTLCAEYFS